MPLIITSLTVTWYDAFGAFLQMADDSAGKGRGDVSPGGILRPRKRITSGLAKVARPCKKMGIALSQLRAVLEQDVGGSLALINRPVVWQGKVTE